MNLITSNIYRLRKGSGIPNVIPTVGAIRFVSNTHDSITVEWDAGSDSDGTIAEYQVRYTDFDTETTSSKTVPGNVLSTTLTQLNTGTYSIRYRAKDNDGDYSVLSDAIVYGTDFSPTDTTYPVFNNTVYNAGLYLSDQSVNSLLCHWDVTDNVGVTSQRIYYRTTPDGPWNYVVEDNLVSDGNGDYNYELFGLDAFTEYEVKVRAYDAAGNFTESSSDTRTTSANGTAPTFSTPLTLGTVTKDSVAMSWVSTDDIGITSQTLKYRVVGTETWNSGGLFSYSTSYTFGGLTSGMTYEFYIQACDGDGQCTDSGIISATPDRTPPVFTTPLSATEITSTTIQLEWLVTDNVGVYDMIVYSRKAGTTHWFGSYINPDTTSRLIQDINGEALTTNSSYEFQIKACDAENSCTTEFISVTTL